MVYAPDEAAAVALESLLHSGHLQAHYQPADSSSGKAGDSVQRAALDPGSITVCLTAAAFAQPVAADEAAQRPWNRQLAALLPWLAPQHSNAAMVPLASDAPLSPCRIGVKSVGGANGSSEPNSPPQSPLARRKVRSWQKLPFLACCMHVSVPNAAGAEMKLWWCWNRQMPGHFTLCPAATQ